MLRPEIRVPPFHGKEQLPGGCMRDKIRAGWVVCIYRTDGRHIKELCLGAQVVFHRHMIVEVVLREVCKHRRSIGGDPPHAVNIERVGS